jgi:hypothetical protein
LAVELPDTALSDFDRLVARDLLKTLRTRIVASPLTPDAARYFDLKWPPDADAAAASDADIAKELVVTRAQLRTTKKKVVDRILLTIRKHVHDEGLRGREADGVLEGYLAILAQGEPA